MAWGVGSGKLRVAEEGGDETVGSTGRQDLIGGTHAESRPASPLGAALHPAGHPPWTLIYPSLRWTPQQGLSV